MKSNKQTIRGLFRELAPLLVFWGTYRFWGLRPAVIASMALAVIELARKLSRGERPGAFFLFSVFMAVGFGALDLMVAEPLFLKYEAALSSGVMGAFMLVSLFRGKSFIEELRANGNSVTASKRAFYRGLTLVWVLYFFAKAAVYAWVAQGYSIDQAIWIRMIAGSLSFYALLGASVVGGPVLYRYMERKGWFGSVAVATN